MKRFIAILAALSLIYSHALGGTLLLMDVGGGSSAPTSMITPVFSAINDNKTGTLEYGSFTGGVFNAANTLSTTPSNAVPIPIPVTLISLAVALPNATTSGTVGGSHNNGAGVPATLCTMTSGGGAPPPCAITSTETFAAGDNIQWQLSGYTTSAGIGQVSALFKSATNQGFLSGFTSSTVGLTTGVFMPIGAATGAISATEPATYSFMPGPGTFSGLYALSNLNDNNTNQHVTMFRVNAGNTTLTCTNASGNKGCCVNPTGAGVITAPGGTTACTSAASVHVNTGDAIDIEVSCGPTACNNIVPAYSVIWTPDVGNWVPVFSATGPPGIAQYWMGLTDYALTVSSSNNSAQLVPPIPTSMVLSNLLYCVSTAPTGGARVATLVTGTSAGVPPTTLQSLSATIPLSSPPTCPSSGSSPALSYFGSQDTNAAHNFSAAAGDMASVTLPVQSGTSGSQGFAKISMQATVQ